MCRAYILQVIESECGTRLALILQWLGGIRFVMLMKEVELTEDILVLRRNAQGVEDDHAELIVGTELLERFIRWDVTGHHRESPYEARRSACGVGNSSVYLLSSIGDEKESVVDLGCRTSLRPHWDWPST